MNKFILLCCICIPILSYSQEVDYRKLISEEGNYIIPIATARMLVEDAFKYRYLDTLNVKLTQENDSLRSDLANERGITHQLRGAFDEQVRLHDKVIEEGAAYITGLEGKKSKETKLKKFWKSVSVTLAALVVVETVILITQP